ncbi:MAG: M3 family oligoendopeptidase, partial [Chitinophagaceae bacterium]
MPYTADIKKESRSFLPQDFVVTDWPTLEPYFNDLLARDVSTGASLEKFLKDLSELEAVVSEDACWRQIKMTCDTENKNLEEAFNFFCLEIQPKIQPLQDALNKKLLASPALKQLDTSRYETYLRSIKNNIAIFNEENIPLQAEMAVLQQQFGQITGAMLVTVQGNSYTLQQAAKFLENEDRSLREEVYHSIQQRRLQDRPQLNELFDKLVKLRNQQALNAGFENYRDYRFKELGRFD